MDDVRRQDLRLFLREMASPGRLLLCAACIFLFWNFPLFSAGASIAKLLTIFAILGITAFSAYTASVRKRFRNKRFEALWSGCQDRLQRFHEVLGKMRREQVLDLNEVPKTITRTSDSIYYALRRADIISHEVQASERGLYSMPPVWNPPTSDPQSNELYKIADRNIAEYRQGFAGVMAGVQRTEAQSAVFMTTVDTLRMRLLGFRLVGKSPELSSHDFLEALAEAKVQLQSIDHALEELDLGAYPKTIAVESGEDRHVEQGP